MRTDKIPAEIELSLHVGKGSDLTELLTQEVKKIKEVLDIKPELLKIKITSDYRATYTPL